jgi:hypothetical protein
MQIQISFGSVEVQIRIVSFRNESVVFSVEFSVHRSIKAAE